MPPAPEPLRPVFKLTPHRMELNSGESIDVTLEGCVDMCVLTEFTCILRLQVFLLL